ncbi:putative N-acetyltransferase YhbS [Geomicrobium halophilum]|uniref:Putative N-acetyltransferase YhbS n=1 Tax=Geomicrobium halophilum TaxID=549000 RepID=A0A841PSW3_9BACL|nr:N-acetyltransferase [Geomicrobium halophilum]MBB6450854.1 putative N-acetyltransferase YhbS [Geomicrobium halophilum]
MTISIRQERPEDYKDTEKVIINAFADVALSDQNEHVLVSRIRTSDAFIPSLSVVAINGDKEVIGHILLSKIKIVDDYQSTESLALAPVSVLPEYQSQGIGKRLILESLEKANELGYHSVIVMGHPKYYPKFGFKKASLWGIKAPFEIPEETLMALELRENSLHHVSGVVEYPSVFFE